VKLWLFQPFEYDEETNEAKRLPLCSMWDMKSSDLDRLRSEAAGILCERANRVLNQERQENHGMKTGCPDGPDAQGLSSLNESWQAC
jgi:hypothetical protein